MGMFDKMKDAKNMYSNIKKAQNEIDYQRVREMARIAQVEASMGL